MCRRSLVGYRSPGPQAPPSDSSVLLYLLDANLITANDAYYPIDRVPEFWSWLVHHGTRGNAKMPMEIFEEIKDGRGPLPAWIKAKENKQALIMDKEVDAALVSRVVDIGYADNLADDEVEKIGRDPFLVAYALVAPAERCVVTTEVSKPTKRRANRRLPDVCESLGVKWMDSFGLLRELNFSTSWKP